MIDVSADVLKAPYSVSPWNYMDDKAGGKLILDSPSFNPTELTATQNLQKKRYHGRKKIIF